MVTEIEICGRCFDRAEAMQFFPQQTNRIAVAFGRNGSGKNTVVRTFSQAGSPTNDDVSNSDIEEASYLRGDGPVPRHMKLNACGFTKH